MMLPPKALAGPVPRLLWATATAARAAGRARTGVVRRKGSFAPRVGKAVEPDAWQHAPVLVEPSRPLPHAMSSASKRPEVLPPLGQIPQATEGGETQELETAADEILLQQDPSGSIRQTTSMPPTYPSSPSRERGEPASSARELSTTADVAADGEEVNEEQRARQAREEAKESGPLKAVLLMQPPDAVMSRQQHPHLSPPPYVHHFDSYSLVKQLQEGGCTLEQATTAMKAIRTLLAQNLDVAQRSLVSKSDVENETYLFTAACSELSTEIKNNRRLRDEQMRQQRTHLQHEVDILTQSLNQELLTLTDTVRGMFNDRKMTVREELKSADSAIQKIHYKMSILLSSDSKSEIEAVRWILIRRSVVGILFMAMLTLAALRYATYVTQRREREAEREADRGRAEEAAAMVTTAG